MIKRNIEELWRQGKKWEENSIIQIKMVEQKEEIKCRHLVTEDLDICSRPGKKIVVKC